MEPITEGLHHGNCLELVKRVPDKSVRLVVTDPPYSVGTTSNGRKGDWLDNNLIEPFFRQFVDQLDRVVSDDGEVYIHTDWRTYPLLFPIVASRFVPRNLVVWDYEWIKAGAFYRFTHEFILYANREDTKRTFGAGEPDVWREKPLNFTRPGKRHATEKPVGLTARMIRNSSKPGDLVLDPFAGTGTVGAVCAAMGRRFVGFEINPRYFEIASARLGAPLEAHESAAVAPFAEA